MLQRLDQGFVAGNYFDKYRSSNPVHQWLMNGFLRSAVELIAGCEGHQILEAGCGPGDLAARILPEAGLVAENYVGTDVCPEQVRIAQAIHPQFQFRVASIYELPVEDKSIDLLIACEVLEHLDEPEKALREIARVCRGNVLLSVPREPLWCGLNMIRGKYLSQFGNTPGHLQNFTPKAIRCLCERYFEVQQERRPLPWTMFLLGPKN